MVVSDRVRIGGADNMVDLARIGDGSAAANDVDSDGKMVAQCIVNDSVV